jgi:hypothetical protein
MYPFISMTFSLCSNGPFCCTYSGKIDLNDKFDLEGHYSLINQSEFFEKTCMTLIHSLIYFYFIFYTKRKIILNLVQN